MLANVVGSVVPLVRLPVTLVQGIESVLEQRSAEIREGMLQIIGKARHTQLTEPEKQTLTRQIASFLERLDGMTVEGKSVIERVIFADCRGFPTNY